MIRNAVVHLLNDQPLLADLFAAPRPSDAVLVCTNVRGYDGKAPTFIARKDGIFVFPMTQMRFIELPPMEMDEADSEPEPAARSARQPAGDAGIDDEPAEATDDRALTVVDETLPESPFSDDDDLFGDDLLRRIREI